MLGPFKFRVFLTAGTPLHDSNAKFRFRSMQRQHLPQIVCANHPHMLPAPMHDWSKFEARQAASLRHQRALRPHTGYPRSSGLGLRVLCECGMDCGTVNDWERHLLKLIEETVE